MYNDGFRKGIEFHAKFCRASFDADNSSCDNCIMTKYNTSGISCQAYIGLHPEVLAKLLGDKLPAEFKSSEDYMKGFKEGIGVVPTCCAINNGDCETCFLGKESGDEDCIDFCASNASQIADAIAESMNEGISYVCLLRTNNPSKTLGHSIKEGIFAKRSYYDEFCRRFPESVDSLEDIATACCRNACFGKGDCSYGEVEQSNCEKCWGEEYGEF